MSTICTFSETDINNIEAEITSLNAKKATTFNNIPAKKMKQTSDICSPTLNKIWYEAVSKCTFPAELKLADITAIFKDDDNTIAKNYRPISVLPVVSKVFERLLQSQIFSYIEEYLSPF